MKYVGFIREHNPIPEAISFQSVKDSSQHNDPDFLSKTLEYLKKGKLVLGWMGYVKDLEDNRWICPDAYYTDGAWIWPLYFPYYLAKYPNYPLGDDFVQYLYAINFEFNIDPSIDIDVMENDLARKFREE